MLATKISSTSHANSEFHGDCFTHGREEQRVSCLAGIFKMACSWLSKQRWRAMLCKTTTRLSAEVGKFVFVHLLSPIFTNWFAPTAVHVALWSSCSTH